jgi:hypothetical protein
MTPPDRSRGARRARRRTTAGAAALAAAFGIGAAHGGTISVPGDFDTIQAAIDAAIDGDEIVVAPGQYAEAIDLLGKAIAVTASDGPAVTTIDATGLGSSAVLCAVGEGRDTVLEGFTITGGAGTPDAQGMTRGGGVLVIDAGPTITSCVLAGNQAARGAGLHVDGGAPLLVGCEFVGNFAGNLGGGAHLDGGAAQLIDCAFTANVGTNGGGVACTGADALIEDCSFTGNNATNGCGLFISGSARPLVADCRFAANFGLNGGGIQSDGAEPVIRACTLVENMVTGRGAGLHINGGAAVVANCRFHGNIADGFGGGLWNRSARVTIVNAVLSGNAALLGGGMANDSGGSVLVYHSSLTANAAFLGAGIHNADGTVPTVLNCILWGNFGEEIAGDATVEHTVVQGGYPGANNLDADPLFAQADGDDGLAGTEDDDLRLGAGSPAVDAGRNDLVPADLADLDGDGDLDERTPLDHSLGPRFADDPDVPDTGFGTPPVVDLGAYERLVQSPADVDGDGDVDVDDLLAVILTWGECPPGPCPADVDGSGTVDVDDLVIVILSWSAQAT